MTDYVSSSGDGMIWGTDDAFYSNARNSSDGFDITSAYHTLGQWRENAGMIFFYWTRRMFLKFDTSAIPDSAIITSVKLRLTAQADNSSIDFDVQIVKQNWSSQDPIASGTREAAYDGCLSGTADNNIWRNTSGMSINTPYESGELDTTWINKTGNTYYSLRSSLDYAGTEPSLEFTENESIAIYTCEATTSSYRPYLVITYTIHYMRIIMAVHSS